MKKIIIIGGGISGLTAAFELVEQGYEIIIIERNNIVGGLARTYQDENNKVCPYEYSWRAYGKWYQNVYNIMKRIPFNDKETVYDKLVILEGGKITCNKKIKNYTEELKNISFPINVILTFLKYLFSCDERNRENFGKISLKEYITINKLSKEIEDTMGKIVGPYLGFDYHNASLYDLLYFYEMYLNNSSEYNFNITSLPTNFVWFDPWIKLLKSKGVTILLNTEVISINIINNIIDNIIVHDKIINNNQILKADYYINCTGPEILKQLLEPYKFNSDMKLLYSNINNVAKNGNQIQLSIYYYINKKIFLEKNNTLAYLPNTPWLLMVLSTGHIWGDEYMSKYCSSDIKEIISIGICEPYVDGLLIKKPWSKCTRKEIEIEAWYQLINDVDFKNNICIEDNVALEDIKIIQFKMWDSYVYENGEITTYEPKWANNINTIQYRPNPKTILSNLVLGGSYTNTTTGTFSMESAAESGKSAAKLICKIDNKKENIYLYTKKKYMILKPIRYIDSLLYNNILIIVIFFIIVIVKNKYF
jgi:hypothetical protein